MTYLVPSSVLMETCHHPAWGAAVQRCAQKIPGCVTPLTRPLSETKFVWRGLASGRGQGNQIKKVVRTSFLMQQLKQKQQVQCSFLLEDL